MPVAWLSWQHILRYSWKLITNVSYWVWGSVYMSCLWLWSSWSWYELKLEIFWYGWAIQNSGLCRAQTHSCSASEDSLNGCTTASPRPFPKFSWSAPFFVFFWRILSAFTSKLHKRITSCYRVYQPLPSLLPTPLSASIVAIPNFRL